MHIYKHTQTTILTKRSQSKGAPPKSPKVQQKWTSALLCCNPNSREATYVILAFTRSFFFFSLQTLQQAPHHLSSVISNAGRKLDRSKTHHSFTSSSFMGNGRVFTNEIMHMLFIIVLHLFQVEGGFKQEPAAIQREHKNP